MVKYCLLYAKEQADISFDVFNCLNIMHNSEFITELKFGLGDGMLNYYMYNFALKDGFIAPNKIGTVLV